MTPVFDSSAMIPSPTGRRLYRLVRPAVDRACGLMQLNEAYEASRGQHDGSASGFLRYALERLGIEISFGADERLRALQRHRGGLLVVANHPMGGADSFALALLLEHVRPGAWKLFSNRLLAGLPELRSHLIAVHPRHDPSRNPHGQGGLREGLEHLRSGGLLAMFPAGRVSGYDATYRRVMDPPWDSQCVRLARSAGAAIAVVRIDGRNGLPFLAIPRRFPRLRTLFLARAVMKPAESHLRLALSPVIQPSQVRQLAKGGNAGAKLHARCYLMPVQGENTHTKTGAPSSSPAIAAKGICNAVNEDVRRLLEKDGTLAGNPPYEVLLFRRGEAPDLFREVARLREVTFRRSGQGSGKPLDETPEDAYYDQLVLWNTERREVVGAYRFGRSDEVLASREARGMYLDHVFRIDPAFYNRIGPGLELSRSFVRPEYQRDPLALGMLWRGLGAFVARNPQYETLYGSVTIPRTFSPEGRAVLVDYLQRHHGDDPEVARLVKARCPWRPRSRLHLLARNASPRPSLKELRETIALTEEGKRPIPPLIRHYLSLQARFLAFHVEAEFGDALYCLMRVDLASCSRRHLRRFREGK